MAGLFRFLRCQTKAVIAFQVRFEPVHASTSAGASCLVAFAGCRYYLHILRPSSLSIHAFVVHAARACVLGLGCSRQQRTVSRPCDQLIDAAVVIRRFRIAVRPRHAMPRCFTQENSGFVHVKVAMPSTKVAVGQGSVLLYTAIQLLYNFTSARKCLHE
jgi:hypothetical protein